MTLNNVAFGKHQERFEQLGAEERQLSIYDFLPEEKSQEVQPSESVPQVDEAQESEKLPSSDLETCKDCMNAPILDGECSNPFCKPTEDTDKVEELRSTDKTLFSVGDTVKVRKADEIYNIADDPEDYYHVRDFEGEIFIIEAVAVNYVVTTIGEREYHFYKEEIFKI
ncbi:hypothetical protein [Bacillus thuringiensis]|uniref:hypothetical protein n=1 Tax=Bacillus thuringiensis TaxID=1428 RepID=UPI000BFDB2A7|nr:hypothetical protein [Bacillus thuringiensis]PGM38496.1 hypothetical protein CN945_01130 [Bacillus thuringiensis]